MATYVGYSGSRQRGDCAGAGRRWTGRELGMMMLREGMIESANTRRFALSHFVQRALLRSRIYRPRHNHPAVNFRIQYHEHPDSDYEALGIRTRSSSTVTVKRMIRYRLLRLSVPSAKSYPRRTKLRLASTLRCRHVLTSLLGAASDAASTRKALPGACGRAREPRQKAIFPPAEQTRIIAAFQQDTDQEVLPVTETINGIVRTYRPGPGQGARVLLMSSIGSTAITLTKANHIVLLDPVWSAYDQHQIIGRVNRYADQEVLPVTERR
ncbi:uncharacterized protein MKK02DRAFT_28260 [Dioszegia hungarica]|uniref:Helicase C-terminal domain-containing protein n=1 Tax=Dioszegia hungarica TaxID=4972 RepID=A0AA38LTC2_9TREE|nr:uncharacterized protein MKK02DRAFT_28260 [Dioszegia hungarica]KAI9634543.1 hypothetical protein MKK02DRAFT_28260 [Dioszegia hungarica]